MEMSAGFSITMRQDHKKMLETKQLIDVARSLGQPKDYFSGLDWGGEILPREIVSFCRMAQDHRTSGWEGISAKAGRYDQHARYVLLVALSGSGSMGVETETRQIGEGEAHLLFPHQIHYYIDLPDNFSWLYVTFELEGPARQILELWRNGGRKLDAKAEDLLRHFLSEYQDESGLGASMALGKVFEAMEAAQPAMSEAEPDTDLVARIKKHVMENLEGDLAMPALSQAMGVSESYLRAVFREGAGVSLGNFVRSVRLVRATYLLELGELDLGVIAERTGFGSLTSFTRAFRRMYAMTPSSYRKRSRIEA
ncbi:MAG: AraC family L-rhamnose operon transcriptional activator RhaR [Akkermansiaceae bacterium]|jgi:AraC family L-rhamnose operon transcriptional activator RhaR